MAGNVSYTLDNYIVPGVVRNAKLPLSNVTYQAADIAVLSDDEISSEILKVILSTREGYYLRYIDLTPDSNGMVQIPYRTIGGRIHKVQFISGTLLMNATRIEPSDLTNTVSPPTNSYAFYIQGNDIVTLPAQASIRVWFFLRPSSLTPQANCGQVTAITSTTVDIASTPSSFVTGYNIDFVQDQPPFGLISYDQALTNVSGTTLTFAAGVIPSTLAVGDWICPAGQSPVAQIPLEFQPILKQRVTVRILEIQGHLQRLAAAQAKLRELEDAVFHIINPRVEENPRKITPDRGILSPGFGRRTNWIG